MPDWSYQTLLRPALFRLPAGQARAVTLGALGQLGRHPIGPSIIALMGHTRPAASLADQVVGLSISTALMISADLPGNETALPALARFGVGLIEVGPVALAAVAGAPPIRQPASRSIWQPQRSLTGVSALLEALHGAGRPPTQVLARLAHAPDADPTTAATERASLIARLAPVVSGFTLTPPPADWSVAAWASHLAVVAAAARSYDRPLLIGLTADDRDRAEALVAAAGAVGLTGVLVTGAVAAPQGGWLLGEPARRAAVELTRWLHERWPTLTILAGGVIEPRDALALEAVGARLCLLDAGLTFSGPGLPKRINEARRFISEPAPVDHWPTLGRRWLTTGWPWLLLLGLVMLVSGVVVWLVAATRVILTYDEAFVGLSREQLAQINPRLLAFMVHDRITLAGTSIAAGVLYVQLAWHGLRFGEHWAWRSLLASVWFGFASFLLFLGFGYFDPLHACLTLMMVVLCLGGMRRSYPAPPRIPMPDLVNDAAWSTAMWGQLGVVSLGLGLIAGGLAIARIGVTSVFVPEDLAFMQTTAETFRTPDGRLLALIAHDRASFGGALVSTGLAVLTIGLWGIRRGARWVWWTLLLAGLSGFIATLGVHANVGYVDAWHLAPAIIGALLFIVSLVLLRAFLLATPPPRAASG